MSWGPGIRYGNYCKEVRNQQGTVVGLLLEVKFTNWDWSTQKKKEEQKPRFKARKKETGIGSNMLTYHGPSHV